MACRLIKRVLLRCISSCFISSASRSRTALYRWESVAYAKAIAQTYNVSLIVVKQAWSELINAGVITSQRGSGSVVSAVPEGVSYGHTFRGITSDLRDASVAVENRILEIATRRARDAQEDGLSLPAHHHYLYISRVRYLNNRPFNHEKIYLDLSFSRGSR